MSSGPWITYLPGEVLRCPTCRRGLGIFGAHFYLGIRIHPHGHNARPTLSNSYVRNCDHRCGQTLEIRIDQAPREVHKREEVPA